MVLSIYIKKSVCELERIEIYSFLSNRVKFVTYIFIGGKKALVYIGIKSLTFEEKINKISSSLHICFFINQF